MSNAGNTQGDERGAGTEEVMGRLSRLRKAIKERRWAQAVITLVSLLGAGLAIWQGIEYHTKWVLNSELGKIIKDIPVILLIEKPPELPDFKQKALIAFVTKHRDTMEEGEKVHTEYLLQLGNIAFSMGNLSLARHYYDRGIKQARANENQVNEAAALVNLATLEVANERNGGLAIALKHAADALKIHQDKQMTEQQADDFAVIGRIRSTKQESREAVMAYDEARKLYAKLGKFGRVADMDLALGKAYDKMGELSKALDRLKSAHKGHSEAGKRKGLAEDLLQMGEIYWKQKKTKLALQDLQEARKIFSEQSLEGDEASALSDLGTLYLEMGDRDQALEQLQKSVRVLKKRSIKRKKHAWSLYHIGLVFTDKGSTESGVEYMLRAVGIAREINDQLLEAQALYYIALAHKKRGQFDRALQNLEDARSVHNLRNFKPGEALALAEIGLLKRDLGELREARTNLESALRIFREEGDRDGEAVTLSYLGLLFMDRGELHRARRYLWKAYSIYNDMRKWKQKAEQLVRLACIYREAGEPERALDIIARARRVYEACPDELGQAHMHACLGFIYKDQGEMRKARKHFTWAHEVFQRETGDAKEEATVKSEIAIAKFRLKEFQRLPLATLKAALDLHRQIGFRRGEATTLGYMGHILLHKDEFEDALNYSRTALRLHRVSRNERGTAAMYDQIGLIQLRAGKSSEANKSFARALGVYEEIGDHRGQMEVLLELAIAKLKEKDSGGAFARLRKVEKLARYTDERRIKALHLVCRSAIYGRKGNLDQAAEDLRKAAVVGKGITCLGPLSDLAGDMLANCLKSEKDKGNEGFCRKAKTFFEYVQDRDDWTRAFSNRFCKPFGNRDCSEAKSEVTANDACRGQAAPPSRQEKPDTSPEADRTALSQ